MLFISYYRDFAKVVKNDFASYIWAAPGTVTKELSPVFIRSGQAVDVFGQCSTIIELLGAGKNIIRLGAAVNIVNRFVVIISIAGFFPLPFR